MRALQLTGFCLLAIGCSPDSRPMTTSSHGAANAAAAFSERADERADLVEALRRRGIGDDTVLAAMGRVPRHAFVPAAEASAAYADKPLAIGFGQTISQPYIVAYMTELLGLRADARVLEIGTGSGYQAAVLAELTEHVWSIEIVEPVAQRARRTLHALGYDKIALRVGDGYEGWIEAAPFDAVIVTAAGGTVPPALLEQLAPTGRLVMPIEDAGSGGQWIWLYTKSASGALKRTRMLPVRFVPLTGRGK